MLFSYFLDVCSKPCFWLFVTQYKEISLFSPKYYFHLYASTVQQGRIVEIVIMQGRDNLWSVFLHFTIRISCLESGKKNYFKQSMTLSFSFRMIIFKYLCTSNIYVHQILMYIKYLCTSNICFFFPTLT